jgi:translation initiation factor IF-1
MPGVTARSATKNMSRSKRAAANKNARRVEKAVNQELDFCTFGKITKALGNKMFLAVKPDRAEHLCHIRGKMARIEAGDIVLLNERDYESRAYSTDAVFDIMAVFAGKDINRLIRSQQIPSWMASRESDGDCDELRDLFDYEEESEDEDEDDGNTAKKDKKKHSKASKNAVVTEDSDVDIDAI